MRFAVHTSVANGPTPGKFFVEAVPAVFAGVWSVPDRDILRPDIDAIAESVAYRFRKAVHRGRGLTFWYDKRNKWNGKGLTGQTPYVKLYGSRGQWLATLYAIPCPDEEAES